MLLFYRLQFDRLDVLFEWNWSGAKVSGFLEIASSPLAPCVGQTVDIVIHGGRAEIDRQLLHFETIENRLDQSKRKADLVGDATSRGFTAVE